MGIECRLIFPNADDREMVLPPRFLEELEAYHAFFLVAVGGEFQQEWCAIRYVVGREIHVCDDVELGVLREKTDADSEEQKS